MRKTQSKYEIAPRARKLGIAIVCGLVASLFIPSSYAFANDDQSYAKMRDWISNFQADEVIPSGTRLTEKDRTILEKFIPPVMISQVKASGIDELTAFAIPPALEEVIHAAYPKL